MSIPDVTPTDLVKNFIGLFIVVATLFLYIQGEPIPVQLDIAFWAVLAAYGFSVAQPVVAKAMLNMSKRPQDGK